MWLENLRELKDKTGMSSKQIADIQSVSEKSVKRVFTGEAKREDMTDTPYKATYEFEDVRTFLEAILGE